MDDKKSMSWWDFAAPQELKDKVDAVANRLKLDDDAVRKLLDKIAPPHIQACKIYFITCSQLIA